MEIPEKLTMPEWRVNHLYSIVDGDGLLIPFRDNEAQANFRATRAARNIILKSRQLGFTTQACVEMLDACIWNRNYNAVIIAHDLESLQRIFHKIEVAWDNLDPAIKAWLGIECTTRNKSQMEWNNGSRIAVSLSTRSDTVNWLHISEFGKICAKYPLKAIEIITGAIPSVPLTGRITIESTAEGEYGSFYEMFWEAYERGCDPRSAQEYKSFFFPWTGDAKLTSQADIPLTRALEDYQKLHDLTRGQTTWYALQKATLKTRMPQEYPTTPHEAFISSGAKVFDPDVIEYKIKEIGLRIAKGDWDEPRLSGDWIYYHHYVPSHRYGMGVDVGSGGGLDHSAIVIIDFTLKTPKIVARYKNNRITAESLPYEILAGANLYGNPIVAVERNNMGHTTLTVLRDIYPNIYTEVVKDTMSDKMTERLGFLTTRASKPRIIFNLKDAVNEGNLDIPDVGILREARAFDHSDMQVVNPKTDDETSRHFDVLMATAIAYEMASYAQGGEAKMHAPALRNPHKSIQ